MFYINSVTVLLFFLSHFPERSNATPIQSQIRPPPIAGLLRANSDLMGSTKSYYNPNIGYEPYWEDGDWVNKHFPKDPDNMCGGKCTPAYKNFGQVCGRDRLGYMRTFDSYCDMQTGDCGGTNGWLMLYRGKCLSQPRVAPIGTQGIKSRPNWYAKNFSSKYGTGKRKGIP